MAIWDNKGLMIYCLVMAVVLGAVFGSFLNCTAWRIAHKEPFMKGRSHCVHCGHELGVLDLVPVVSWLALRGKCRYCGGKVSVRYLLTELSFALLTFLCVLRFGPTALCLRNWIFIGCLFCLSLVDLDTYTIPDGCLVVALIAWVVALPFVRMSLREILFSVLAGVVFGGGLLVVSLILDHVLKKESLGGGDIKLFGVVGLYLGMAGTLFAMVFACILGLVFALRKRRAEGEGMIPFGPFISLAAIVMLLFGEGLVNWYLGLLRL